MKNGFFLLASLLVWYPSLLAQKAIEVNYTQDAQGNINFFCTNRAFCNYILKVDLTSLDNARSDHPLPYIAEVKPGNYKLFKLSRTDVKNPIQFKYTVASAKGCVNPHVDTGFTYILPISPGKEAQAYEITNTARSNSGGASAAGGSSEPGSLYAVRLKMKPGDTLYAARRGRVTGVDVSSDRNDAGLSSSADENYIEIVHADCSFGLYGMIRKGGAFVKPGQFVEAGEPIGLVGGDKYGRGSEARLSVYYNRDPDEAQTGTGTHWAYMPLKFWTKGNGKGMLRHGAVYISEFPKSILNQEKSKPSPAKAAAKTKGKRKA